VTPVLNWAEEPKEPAPRMVVHAPVPVPGFSPASVVVLAQTVWSGPAEMAKVLLNTLTSSSDEQALFVIVHLKVFVPGVRPVTPLLKVEGELMMPSPLTRLHAPVPTVGMLPASVAVVPQTPKSAPAVAVVGRSFVTFTSSLAAQPFCVTVQRSVFMPGLIEPSALLKAVGVEMLAEPTTTVQRPVPPETGAVPAKVAAVLHTVWSTPAVTVKALLLTTTSSKYEHALFVIVQRKVFVPEPRPVTAELFAVGIETVPEPTRRVQRPVPMTGWLPASVVEVPQTTWSAPAVATVGSSFETMTSSENVQPFWVTDQRNEFVPLVKAVSAGLATAVDEKVALPAVMVQTPVPTPTDEPASEVVLKQIDWSGPALTAKELFDTLTSSELEQPLFDTVQRKVFVPTLSPLTAVAGFDRLAIVPRPVKRVQVPVPITGALPERVAAFVQTEKSAPALAAVGTLFTRRTSSNDEQPFCVTVQRRTLLPLARPVTVVVFRDEAAKVALPTLTVQAPVPPRPGAEADSVAKSTHRF